MISKQTRIAIFVLTVAVLSISQMQMAYSQEMPPVLARFSQKVPADVSAEVFYKQAEESLWDVYPEDESIKPSLLAYIRQAKDGPVLGYAALALIPFHDPSTVRPILERAMQSNTSPATRWCMLNAAPYIMGMGDVMYMEDGKLDTQSRELAKELMSAADDAVQSGLGHMHAVTLQKLLDLPASDQKEDDYGLAVWHTSAYLLGTIDLKDQKMLSRALTSRYSTVFQNALVALSFQTNRDLLAELKKKEMREVTPAMEQSVGQAASLWWQGYLKTHPSGDWTDAVLEGYSQAGYKVDPDFKSPQSTSELLRALGDSNPMLRYNAYRIFNRIYATNFDLDVAFFTGKYALSFLDPSAHEQENEARLKRYWQKRLQPQTVDTKATLAAPASISTTAAQPLSLAEQARRIREQKSQKK